jgi:hypothetical protein
MSSQENNIPDLNLDEFLPMPGSEDILTAPETSKTTVFSKPKDLDTTFLEAKEAMKKEEDSKEDDKKGELKPAELEAAREIVSDLFDEQDDSPKASSGRPKVDKSGLVDTFSKLIDEGLIVPFDDEKPMDQYSINDWKELIQANFEERENKVKQEVPASFFDSLPNELKYAYKYISDGGHDLKGLFKALSHVEEVRELDPSDDNDQELIARQYLRATQFGTEDEIDEEIETWKDLGNLNKKAAQFKPKLDKMQQQVVEYQLQQQEVFRQQQEEAAHQYMDNVYSTLKQGSLNGVRLDKKTQAFLFTELTQPKYQSMQGKSTNLLGHLLEHYQYIQPRYDLIAETLWLLADPEGYKSQIRQLAKNEVTQETVRKLKTEESRKIATSSQYEEEDRKPAKRTIPRQQNIFKR